MANENVKKSKLSQVLHNGNIRVAQERHEVFIGRCCCSERPVSVGYFGPRETGGRMLRRVVPV